VRGSRAKTAGTAHPEGAALASDFLAFATAAWPLVCSTPLVVELPQRCVALHLEALATGELKPGAGTLVINVPPGSSKSLLVNVLWPAWLWARDPARCVIAVSHTSELVSRFAAKFRLLVQSDWYAARWPGTRLSRDTASKLSMRSTALGERIGVSVGGSITGSHADVIVVDDLVDARDASNAAAIASANQWHESVLMTRWKDLSQRTEVCIAQRLHVADLPAVLAERGASSLILPATGPGPDLHVGAWHWTDSRAPGGLLAPKRLPQAALDSQRRILGSIGYAAQYQQTPVPAEGGAVRPEWLEHTWTTLPPDTSIYLAADTSHGQGDPTGVLVAAFGGGRLYLLDYLTGLWEFPVQVTRLASAVERYRPRTVYVEAAASGHSVVQTLRSTVPNIVGVPPKGPKDVRLSAITPFLEAGGVLFPASGQWVAPFKAEVLAFPRAPHDECVDVLSLLAGQLLAQPALPPPPTEAGVTAMIAAMGF
jgi:predicted phage terminase large subunit-like protein